MALAADLSPHLISAICYTLSYEERNDDNRRLGIVGVYERAPHAVAARRNLRVLIHPGPVATMGEDAVEFPNGNQIGPLQDPEDPQSRLIGWEYRFRTPGTDDISTIWIEQGSILREATAYGESPEIVNWMDFVAESRIDISDDTTNANGHAGLNGSSPGFVEESDQGSDVPPNTQED